MFRELRPYRESQPIELPWLSSIPEHWRIARVKELLYPIDVRSVDGMEEQLTVSSHRGVVPRSGEKVTMFQAKSYVGHKLCWPGDLVVNSLWAWGNGLGVTTRHGIVSTAYGVYRRRPGAALNPTFLHEFVRCTPFNWELQYRSRGVWKSRLQMTDDRFMAAPLVLPPVDEQAAIVKYLGHAHARIDRAIAAKRKLIALLEEQKQAIIHHAVTRGLDPSVPLKDSGIPWLGEIPAHWEPLSIRRNWRVVDCKHLTVPFTDRGYPLASVRQAQRFDLSLHDAKRTSREHYESLIEGGRKPRPGDLIYCRNVAAGRAAVVGDHGDFAMGQDVALLQPAGEQNGRFLNYFLRSRAMDAQLERVLVGSTFRRINVEQIRALMVATPPASEQREIADFLDADLSDASVLVDRVKYEIDLLREFCARLTSDVVTGQVDVRETAATLPELTDEAPPGFEDEFDELIEDEFELAGADG